MKTLKLLTLTLLTLMNIPFSACGKEDSRPLAKLWADYEKAVNADRPKDQAEILLQIKKLASEQHQPWDYYDACWKYVDARTSSNWKLRDELTTAANNDIENCGEPVAVFYNRLQRSRREGLVDYVKENKERLLQTHNPAFYDHDHNLSSPEYGEFLRPRITNDYEYALWSLFFNNRYNTVDDLIREHYAGRYPFEALIDYSILRRNYTNGEDEKLKAFAQKYEGKAAALLARQFLLWRRQRDLDYNDGTSAQYLALGHDCEAFIAERKKFSGEEKALAECCEMPDDILATLNSQEASVDVTKGKATIVVRNLPSIRVRILDGKKEVFDKVVDNPVKSYYVHDTLTLDLPDIDDKTYTLKCKNGKVETECEYRKYTLSIAHKRDYDGYGVFVADYITGEPVKSCDILLYDEDKLIDQVNGLVIDGFTYLPESMVSKLDGKRWSYSIQAVESSSGRVRKSPEHVIRKHERETVRTDNPARHQAMLLTDRSAFNPDETVHYKVLLYEGTYEFATRPAGIQLHATLTDPTGKEIGSEDLTTNEFGTAAGAFVLTKGERGGLYKIQIKEGTKTIASTEVRADEFVLPSFELKWTPDNRFYLPEDKVLVQGNVRSYSGHNLGTAKASYVVKDQGNVLAEGPLELKPSGDFEFRFTAPKESYWYRNVAVTVRVTDATGETLEFSKSVSVSQQLPLSISILNRVDGRFDAVNSYGGGSIVGENVARVRFQLGHGALQTHPNLKIEYKVLHEGKTILTGTAPNGEAIDLNLEGHPSGMYKIVAEATATNDAGKEFEAEQEHNLVKAADSDTALDMDVRSFFKEIADDGKSISLQVGTTTGPAWIVAELYGDGNRLLEHRVVRLSGVRGKQGSLQVIRFDRKESYPENLTLKVFWFHDANSYEYEISSYTPKRAAQLPLSFSRFLDTTAPHLDYSFTIKTAEGTEVAATIFDKSTETIRPNVWRSVTPQLRSLPDVGYSYSYGVDSAYAFDHEVRSSNRVLGKAAGAPAPMAMERGMVLEDAVAMESADMDSVVESVAEPEEENEAIRENFANTIAWAPFLRSDKDGVVTFNFTTADKLSTYYVQLFAHDKAFRNTTLRQEMVVTLPVKVAVVQPQFLHEGDRYVSRVTLSNSKGVPVSGRISVRFLDGKDYKTAPKLAEKAERITVPAGGSVDFVSEIAAPKVKDLGLLINFTADDKDFGSDGVFVVMPVNPAVQTITEAHSSLLLAGQDRDALIAFLRSQFVNVSGDVAALREISILGMIEEAIPEKVLPQSDNLLDQSEALFANFLIDQLPGSKGSAASPEARAEMVGKILACHNKDGGFGWFDDMTSSPMMTAVLLERLADMGESCPPELSATIPSAAQYLDQVFFGDKFRPAWCGGISMSQYLHTRSLFPEVSLSTRGANLKELRELKKEIKAYLVPGAKRGLNGQVFAKARRMKTLRALVTSEKGASLARAWGIRLFAPKRLRSSLDADIASMLQYAEPHRSGGTYYPNAVMPWRGLLESELYAHSLICDLLTDCGHNEVAEGIRLWIMVQKETQYWEDDPAYIQAIGSVLHGTEETLQTKVLALSASTTLPFERIKAAGNGFTVARSYTRDGQPLQDGDVLHVGDKVTATYSIWNEENRSFVRLTAPRPAAFRPVNQLSGRYGWFGRPISITGWVAFSPQGYRSVLADRTEFWFDSYPEEKTSFSEEFFVTQEGSFQSPVVVIESLYAPHYRANDDGHPAVTVQPQEK